MFMSLAEKSWSFWELLCTLLTVQRVSHFEAWSCNSSAVSVMSVQAGIREQGDTSSETWLIEEIKQDEGGVLPNLTAEK